MNTQYHDVSIDYTFEYYDSEEFYENVDLRCTVRVYSPGYSTADAEILSALDADGIDWLPEITNLDIGDIELRALERASEEALAYARDMALNAVYGG